MPNLDPTAKPRPMTPKEKRARARVAKASFSYRLNQGLIRGSGVRGNITVHDFRKIATCYICTGMGFDLPRVEGKIGKRNRITDAKYAHADCFIIENGMRAFLRLPREQALKCSLDEVGVAVMKKIMDMPEEPPKPLRW